MVFLAEGMSHMARVEGIYTGTRMIDKKDTKVSFFDNGPSGHTFTQEEIDALLAGKAIAYDAHSKNTGNDYTAKGYLGINDRGYVGFIMDFDVEPDLDNSTDRVPFSIGGVKLTDEQRAALEAGERIHVEGCVSKNTGNTYDADVTWEDDADHPGHKRLYMHFDD